MECAYLYIFIIIILHGYISIYGYRTQISEFVEFVLRKGGFIVALDWSEAFDGANPSQISTSKQETKICVWLGNEYIMNMFWIYIYI